MKTKILIYTFICNVYSVKSKFFYLTCKSCLKFQVFCDVCLKLQVFFKTSQIQGFFRFCKPKLSSPGFFKGFQFSGYPKCSWNPVSKLSIN